MNLQQSSGCRKNQLWGASSPLASSGLGRGNPSHTPGPKQSTTGKRSHHDRIPEPSDSTTTGPTVSKNSLVEKKKKKNTGTRHWSLIVSSSKIETSWSGSAPGNPVQASLLWTRMGILTRVPETQTVQHDRDVSADQGLSFIPKTHGPPGSEGFPPKGGKGSSAHQMPFHFHSKFS